MIFMYGVSQAAGRASRRLFVQATRLVPELMGRRMVDIAARLVDEVPEVPVRQFVLSLPFEIRYRLAYDGKLMWALLGVFLRGPRALRRGVPCLPNRFLPIPT